MSQYPAESDKTTKTICFPTAACRSCAYLLGSDKGFALPVAPITRAEAMPNINCVRNRYPDKDYLLPVRGVAAFEKAWPTINSAYDPGNAVNP